MTTFSTMTINDLVERALPSSAFIEGCDILITNLGYAVCGKNLTVRFDSIDKGRFVTINKDIYELEPDNYNNWIERLEIAVAHKQWVMINRETMSVN